MGVLFLHVRNVLLSHEKFKFIYLQMSLVKIDDIKHLISVVFVAVKEVQITYKYTLILMTKKLLSG